VLLYLTLKPQTSVSDTFWLRPVFSVGYGGDGRSGRWFLFKLA
jgi:hypothetical protein